MEFIEGAVEGASKDKRKREEVIEFYGDYENNILLIQDMLVNKTYKTSPYRFFERNDKGKIRELSDLPFFPDRIIHWVVVKALEDMMMNTFISSIYAALPNRGPELALDRLNRDIRRHQFKYCLKIDIKQW